MDQKCNNGQLGKEKSSYAVLGDPANNVAPTNNADNEQLWTRLTLDLRNAYSEYHGAEGAYREIKNLRQKPDMQMTTLFNSKPFDKAGWDATTMGL